MSKFTIEQRKTIKGLVLQALCEQQTLESMAKYVKEKSGFEISLYEAERIAKAFRKEARTWLSTLVRSNYEYLAEYRERINGVKYAIQRANELYRKPAPLKSVVRVISNPDGTETKTNELIKMDNSDLKRKLLVDIANMEKLLMDMYDAMPIVNELVSRKGTAYLKDNSNSSKTSNAIPK
jgi:aspartate/tyrosine/aromatic aminotransferase